MEYYLFEMSETMYMKYNTIVCVFLLRLTVNKKITKLLIGWSERVATYAVQPKAKVPVNLNHF